VLSGNGENGIVISNLGTDNNIVAGNFIGTDSTGTVDLGNANLGVVISSGASFNRIGGSALAARNLISGNGSSGVRISSTSIGESTGNILVGNYIGTNLAGSAAIANSFAGVEISSGSTNNRIGTDGDGQHDAAEGNLISGNASTGITIFGGGSSGNVVAGNRIGTNAAGSAALPNAGSGVFIFLGAKSNRVGGSAPALGNTIAFNNRNGVGVTDSATTGNAVLGNAIFSNAFFGIDLSDDQITPNDEQDVDEGPNRLQNTPEIVEAGVSKSTMRVTYFVPTDLASATYPLRVEFFLADADSHEGQTFLGADVFTAADFLAGAKTFIFVPAAAVTPGDQIVATATDTSATGLTGNTSEFSVDVTVGNNPWFNFNPCGPLDVDGDCGVFATDALDVINYLNAFGAGPVPVLVSGPPFYDTNGDFFVTAADGLDIINFLNAFGAGPVSEPESASEGEASARLQATSAVFAEFGAHKPAIAADLAALLADNLPGSKPRRGRVR
jgi:hypothetical protein